MNQRLQRSTADLVRNWQPGWGLCRGLGAAREVAGGDGLEVALGLPERSGEVFALRADEEPGSVGRLAARVAGAGAAAPAGPVWLTVVTRQPSVAEQAFKEAGLELLGAPERMMTVLLDGHPSHSAPAPYRVETSVRTAPGGGSVVECRVEADGGVPAASGLMGVLGENAVAHRIRTDEAHRRRGLASVVMSELSRRAAMLGARHGLLIASPDGERLYTSLGWTDQAAVLTARLPAA